MEYGCEKFIWEELHGCDEGGEVYHFVTDAEEGGLYDLYSLYHDEKTLVWVV